MSNIVIASPHPICQSLRAWLIDRQVGRSCIDGPPLALQQGEELWIVAHDVELGDGYSFCAQLNFNGIPAGISYQVYLIVCSAQSLNFTRDVVTPAELIANTLGQPVWASQTPVVGLWDQSGAIFTGNFQRVAPQSDLISMMQNLTLNDRSDIV